MLAAVVQPGEEVLFPDPGWPNYRMMPPWLGARALFYPCPARTGFQPDLEALEAQITSRTKVLVVNSPNNPTGAVYPEATVGAMIEIAQRHNLWLLSDECYDQILLDGSSTSPARLAPDDPRIATVFTFSKTYAMTGWRLGYLVGSAELVDTARDFAFTLLRERRVSVAPGSAFGREAAAAVRISLASSDDDLQEGVRRLAGFAVLGRT